MRALAGCAGFSRGLSKNSIAVGPRLGKSQGCLTARPTAPQRARTTKAETAAYSPAPSFPARACRRSRSGRIRRQR